VNKVTALYVPAQRTGPISHPSWCDRNECKNDPKSATVDREHVVARRNVMGKDAVVEVDLVAEDECHPWSKTWTFHPAEARLYLNWLACDVDVPCTVEHEVPLEAEVFLNADEARQLAADLLEVANRIEATGGAR
jgi:hypothetical protein